MTNTGGFKLGGGLTGTSGAPQLSGSLQSGMAGPMLGNTGLQATAAVGSQGAGVFGTLGGGGLSAGLGGVQGMYGSSGLQVGHGQRPALSSTGGGLTLGSQTGTFGSAAKTSGLLGGTTSGLSAVGVAPSGSGLQLGTGTNGLSMGSTGISLGSSLSGSSLKLGAGTSLGVSTAAGGLKLGTGITAGTTTGALGSIGGGGLKLGTSIGTSSGVSGLSGTTTLGSSGFQLGDGISGTATSAPGISLGSTALTGGGLGLGTAPTTTTIRGLGGVDPTQSSAGTSKTDKDGDKAVMKQGMPDELNKLADDMLKFIKAQKSICEDISSASEKPLSKVQDDVKSTSQALSLLAHTVHADGQAVHDLKYQAVQELKNAEIAQRTKETPPVLQHENTLPADYFRAVVQSFEQQMQTYRQQIDDMENYMATLTGEMAISPQVLAEVIRKLHESFIGLAGQIQSSHEAVKVQKEQYLNYRKAFLKDTSDVFEARRRVQSGAKRKVTSGPSPFGGMSGSAALAAVAAANAVAAPTIQQGLAAADRGGLQLGGNTLGLQLGTTSGLRRPAASNLGAGSSGLQLGGSTGLKLGGTSTGLSLGGNSTGLGLGGTSSGLQLGSTGLGLGGGLQLGQGGLSGAQSAGVTLGQQKPLQLQQPPQGKRGRSK